MTTAKAMPPEGLCVRLRQSGPMLMGDRRACAAMIEKLIAERDAARDAAIEECAHVAHRKIHETLPISDGEWNDACRSVRDTIRALKRGAK